MEKLFLMIILCSLFIVFHPDKVLPEQDKTSSGVETYERNNNHIDFHLSSRDIMRLQICREDMLRVTLLTGKMEQVNLSQEEVVVRKSWAPVDFRIVENDSEDSVEIMTSKMTVKIRKTPHFSITAFDKDGKTVIGEIIPGYTVSQELDIMDEHLKKRGVDQYTHKNINIKVASIPDENFYGLGGDVKSFNFKGSEIEGFVGEHPGPKYCIVPFFMSSRGYGFFLNNHFRSRFNMKPDDHYEISAMGGELDFYVFYGPSFKHILDSYTDLTGKPPMFPKWAFGFTIGGWRSNKDYVDIAAKYREMRIPVDAVSPDCNWQTSQDSLVWNNPDEITLQEFMNAMSNMNYRVFLWDGTHPSKDLSGFETGLEKNYYIRKSSGEVPLNKGYASKEPGAYLDVSFPEAVDWWQKQHRHLFEAGLDGKWCDIAGDRPVSYTTGTADLIYHDGTHHSRGGNNLHALRRLKMIYDMSRQYAKDESVSEDSAIRGFCYAAAGWAGAQRYSMIWSGDTHVAGPEDFIINIRSALNMGLSGIPYWDHDMGGFCQIPVNEKRQDRETYVRGVQFAMFTTGGGRAHGQHPLDPWHENFAPEALENLKRYGKIRHELMPYIYSYVYQAHKTGLPVMRPMILEFQDDPAVADMDEQYMLGEEILVAPTLKSSGQKDFSITREVHLPEGVWHDFWTDKKYEGGRTISVNVDFDEIPVFVKAGSVIPMGPPMNFVDEKKSDPLYLHIYPAEKGRFELYEDDGISEDYKTGEFALTDIQYEMNGKEMVIDISRKGSYKGGLKTRTYILKIHDLEKGPKQVNSFAEVDESKYYPEEKILLINLTIPVEQKILLNLGF